MYPQPAVLEELGRVTICGSRVDLQLAFLVHHLDPAANPFDVGLRKRGGGDLTSMARRLAREHLTYPLLAPVTLALDDAHAARQARHDAVHQDWVLRGADALPDGREAGGLAPDEVDAFLNEWNHTGRPSPDWLRLPARSVDLEPAHTVEQLCELERRLGSITARLLSLTCAVANTRDTGKPEGYRRPAEFLGRC